MKKLIFFLLLLLNIFTSSAQNLKKAPDSVDLFITKTVKELNISGLAVAVVDHGKLVKMSCYGKANFDWNIDVDKHTNFQIASTTKLLATTLIMKSIYNKKLSIDDEVGQYLENIPTAWNGLKIRHLLNHTSGIKVYRQNKYVSTEEAIEALKDSTLNYPIGSKQSYASGDYTVLLHILEKIYKMPYPEILKAETTTPLGMVDGAFDRERLVSEWLETDSVSKKSTTYYIKDGNRIPYKFFYPQFAYAAAAYYASISDMANWAIGMDKGVLFPLSFEQAVAYKTDSVGDKISDFTQIGWTIGKSNGIRYSGHSGGPALGDVLRFPDQGITIIALSNDGELLPYFSRSIATFYIPGLSFNRKVVKFKRTKAI